MQWEGMRKMSWPPLACPPMTSRTTTKPRLDELAAEKDFVAERNPIVERARFNQTKPTPRRKRGNLRHGSPPIGRACEYGALKTDLIRDRLVVGIRDAIAARLSEKLQLQDSLALEKAAAEARQSEAVKGQQAKVRNSLTPAANPPAAADAI